MQLRKVLPESRSAWLGSEALDTVLCRWSGSGLHPAREREVGARRGRDRRECDGGVTKTKTDCPPGVRRWGRALHPTCFKPVSGLEEAQVTPGHGQQAPGDRCAQSEQQILESLMVRALAPAKDPAAPTLLFQGGREAP